ncbi:hypothetical protein FF38_04843 [Lucilia cuprina]|uniref:Uncharacterized protein n=1 Tax=Lucilia cuprina TaxID=7375 RepID=A0A0L0CIJ7_LUCCU|nr:hypothetical protein FF38_04843 [Lucilia cuprina]
MGSKGGGCDGGVTVGLCIWAVLLVGNTRGCVGFGANGGLANLLVADELLYKLSLNSNSSFLVMISTSSRSGGGGIINDIISSGVNSLAGVAFCVGGATTTFSKNLSKSCSCLTSFNVFFVKSPNPFGGALSKERASNSSGVCGGGMALSIPKLLLSGLWSPKLERYAKFCLRLDLSFVFSNEGLRAVGEFVGDAMDSESLSLCEKSVPNACRTNESLCFNEPCCGVSSFEDNLLLLRLSQSLSNSMTALEFIFEELRALVGLCQDTTAEL